MKRWESSAAWVYYTLGVLYYAYHWLILLGIGGVLVSLLPKAPQLLTLAGLPLSTLCLFGGLYVWLLKMRKRHEVLNPLLDIIESVDTYTVYGDGNYDFKIAIKVRARQTGIDGYRLKFKWTGQGRNEISVDPPTVTPIPDYRQEGGDIWELTRFQFPRPLRRKEEFQFTIKLQFGPSEKAPHPYLQKLVDDIYSTLRMRVTLPAIPEVVTREIFISPRSDISIFQETFENINNMQVEWYIKRPRVGRRYKISWRLSSDRRQGEISAAVPFQKHVRPLQEKLFR